MGAFKGWQSTKSNPLFAKFQDKPYPKINRYFNINGWNFILDPSVGFEALNNNDQVSEWSSLYSNITFTQSTGSLKPYYRKTFAPFNAFPAVDFSISPLSTLVSSNYYMRSLNFSCAILVNNYSFAAHRNLIIANSNTAAGAVVSAQIASAVYGIGSLRNSGAPPLLSGSNLLTPQICVFSNTDLLVNGVLLASANLDVPPPYNKIGSINPENGSSYHLGFLGFLPYKLSPTDLLTLSTAMNAHFNYIY